MNIPQAMTEDSKNEARLMPFTRQDWYGYSDSIMLPDGREPLIAKLDGFTLILSGWDESSTSASVYVDKIDDDDSMRYATRTFAELAQAEKYANFLAANPEMIEALETLQPA